MLTLALLLSAAIAAPPRAGSVPDEGDPPEGWLRVDRGEGRLPLLVPRGEELSFRVMLDVGILGRLEAGKVALSSGAERYVAGLPAPGAPPASKAARETGWIRSVATGSYAGYDLRHELLARLIPQDWPSVYYTDTQGGSENRRREIRLGRLDGGLVAAYRHDGHCKGCKNEEHFVESRWMWGEPYHCEKCKRAAHRVWKEGQSRAVPEGTVDMLSAVYLARSLVRADQSETAFSLVDKQELWNVFLRRGGRKRIEVPAGRFECIQVLLRTEVPAGEPSREFEGMFGLRGKIRIWLEEKSGVPVRIEGEFPVGILGSLDVQVELVSHRGTPAAFVPR